MTAAETIDWCERRRQLHTELAEVYERNGVAGEGGHHRHMAEVYGSAAQRGSVFKYEGGRMKDEMQEAGRPQTLRFLRSEIVKVHGAEVNHAPSGRNAKGGSR